MDFYRGDNRGPMDATLITVGFSAKPPEQPMSASAARAFLATSFQTKKPLDIGMEWRKQTPGFLVATAMTQTGGFQQMKYFYKISIPNGELTAQELEMNGTLGKTFPVNEASTRNKYFLLFNHLTYQNATLIAFCHGIVHSKEATFLTTIPARYIEGYRSGMSTTKEHAPFAPFRGPHRQIV